MSSDETKATKKQPASDAPEPEQDPSSADSDDAAEGAAPEADTKPVTPAHRPKRGKKGKKAKRGAEKAPEPGPKSGRMGLWLAVVAVAAVVLAVGGYYLARRLAKPKWKVGNEVPVELTLVATDKSNLACAATDEVSGKRCAYDEPRKPSSVGKGADDKVVLKPYTTTDRRNLLAAGLWSEPALAGALPTDRFTVKCTFVIDGMMKQLTVRWTVAGQWSPPLTDWFTGTVKNCTLVPAAAPSAQPSATPNAASSASR